MLVYSMPGCISIRVPATSGNLGCLFDCGALALSLYLHVRVSARTDGAVTVRYQGATPERVAAGEDNLIARTITSTLREWGAERGFDVEIDNQIPISVGLGSSAAAVVAGLAACRWLADRALADEELIALAARVEGHPDNAAAAWEGGLTLVASFPDGVIVSSCPVPDTLRFAVVVPDYAVPTIQARAVLPASYSREEAVHNLQRAAVFVARFFAGKTDFCPALFDDRWHQPHRAQLVPGLDEILKITQPDLVGVCLSGAGPSILAIARNDAAGAGETIRQTLANRGIQSQTYLLAADNGGGKSRSFPTC